MTKARIYAEAVYRASKGKNPEDTARIVARLQEVLAQRGHAVLFPAVLREVSAIVRARTGDTQPVLYIARTEDTAECVRSAEQDLARVGNAVPPMVVVDKTLVGGYALVVDGTRIDRTHKRALLDMYRTLV